MTRKNQPDQANENQKVYFVNERDVRESTSKIFESEKEKLLKILPDCKIEHIGGTSVPNSITKGDLDINVRLPKSSFNSSVKRLKKFYQINQPANWTDSFASFKDDSRNLGIQLTVIDSAGDFFVEQRDFLKAHPGKVSELNRIKLSFEGKNMSEYRLAKGKFFENLKI